MNNIETVTLDNGLRIFLYKDERRHTAKISKKYANLTRQDFLNSLREKELVAAFRILAEDSKKEVMGFLMSKIK